MVDAQNAEGEKVNIEEKGIFTKELHREHRKARMTSRKEMRR